MRSLPIALPQFPRVLLEREEIRKKEEGRRKKEEGRSSTADGQGGMANCEQPNSIPFTSVNGKPLSNA
jgi:hypothetical protein